MTDDGTMTKAGWPQQKLYLSPEAIALLRRHCEGTPMTMSAYVDGLIKANLGEPREPFPPRPTAEPPAASAERAKKAALERGIHEARQALKKQENPFDL